MVEEIFGPVLTVSWILCSVLIGFGLLSDTVGKVYVYEDADFDKTCELVDTTSQYGLTGAM
jgi:1-pyrroline-5-carboxylate dehydrogenase